MSNRAARRQQSRGRLGVQKTEAIPRRHIGEHGIEVDTDNHGLVHFSIFAGEVAVSVAWAGEHAVKIANMILDAVERSGTPAENLVEERGSGLVVARTLPPT